MNDISESTDYVASGSFASLKKNVQYIEKEDYAILIRLVDYNRNWQGPFMYVTQGSYVFLKKSNVNPGDLVISNVGANAGTPFIVPDFQKPMTLGPNSVLVRAENMKFLYYYFRSNIGQHYLKSILSGSAQPKFNKTDFRKLEITIPPIPEQISIARILSALDDKIELNLAMNRTLEEMAMALYKHWFVDFGPFQNGEFIDSELGKIPKGWEVKSVKNFGKVITGKTPSTRNPKFFGGEISFVTPTDFKNFGMHVLKTNRTISDLGANKHKSGIFPADSVVVTCIGSDMGKVSISKANCLSNQQINTLITDDYFFMYCFFTDQYELLKMLAGDGTTMPIINKTSFENIKVIKPSEVELKNFSQKTVSIEKRIYVNSQENQTLTALRDTLLPKLISGEVRVIEAEKMVAEAI